RPGPWSAKGLCDQRQREGQDRDGDEDHGELREARGNELGHSAPQGLGDGRGSRGRDSSRLRSGREIESGGNLGSKLGGEHENELGRERLVGCMLGDVAHKSTSAAVVLRRRQAYSPSRSIPSVA